MNQRAVLWPAVRRNDYGVAVVDVSNPVDNVPVRWLNRQGDVSVSQGDSVGLDATAVTDRDIELGSNMWLAPDPHTSALEQWYGTGSAGNDTELMVVNSFAKIPDVKGRVYLRKVGMVRSRSTRPPAA